MTKNEISAVVLLMLGFAAAAHAQSGPSDEQRREESNGLADCAAYYKAAAQQPDISQQQRLDLERHSLAALKAASRVTNRQVAMTREQETLQQGASVNASDGRLGACQNQLQQFRTAPPSPQ